MAEAKAVIVFDRDHKLDVGMDKAAIEKQIRAITNSIIPLVEIEEPSGSTVLVNAAEIRTITDYEVSRVNFT